MDFSFVEFGCFEVEKVSQIISDASLVGKRFLSEEMFHRPEPIIVSKN